MTQQYTPAQLEAWAGLGPWCALGTDPAEGVDCFWIKGQPNPAMRGFSDEIASVNGSQNDPKRQTNATLIAAAPDLARLVLEKEKEIARYRRALVQIASEGDEIYAASMCDGCDCPALLDFAQSAANIAHSALVDRAIRQAMKETSDE